MPERVFTCEELEDFWGISRVTAYRLRRANKLGFYRIGTRILYGEHHIQEFLQKHEIHAKESKSARSLRSRQRQ